MRARLGPYHLGRLLIDKGYRDFVSGLAEPVGVEDQRDVRTLVRLRPVVVDIYGGGYGSDPRLFIGVDVEDCPRVLGEGEPPDHQAQLGRESPEGRDRL